MSFRESCANAVHSVAVLRRDVVGLVAPREWKRSRLQEVNIEPSNLCNANCVFCGYQFQERTHDQMPIDLGLSIIAEAKRSGVVRLGLTPIVGEPLVHRKLEHFIQAASSPPRQLRVGVTTNGILLSLARYRSLVEAGLSELNISMSFPDEAEYQRLYRSDRLKAVVANVEAIADVYQDGGCRVVIGVRTGRGRGWDDHPLFHRARRLGWTVERNRYFDDWSGMTGTLMKAEGLTVRPNRPKWLPCSMTSSGPHFLSDGQATACGCRDLDGKSELALSASSLLTDMKAVYEKGAVDELRERFRQNRPPAICSSCRHYGPTYEGESLRLRVRQLVADVVAAFR